MECKQTTKETEVTLLEVSMSKEHFILFSGVTSNPPQPHFVLWLCAEKGMWWQQDAGWVTVALGEMPQNTENARGHKTFSYHLHTLTPFVMSSLLWQIQ